MRSSGKGSNCITAANRQSDLFQEKYFSYRSIFKLGSCENDKEIWISIKMRDILLLV
jgi:hypothetical protein